MTDSKPSPIHAAINRRIINGITDAATEMTIEGEQDFEWTIRVLPLLVQCTLRVGKTHITFAVETQHFPLGTGYSEGYGRFMAVVKRMRLSQC